MIGPYMLLFCMFTVLPVTISMFLSFTNYNLLQAPSFVLVENYRRLFLEDDVFLTAIKNTLVIAVITGPISYMACFLLAWMINDFNPKIRAILTTVFYAPSISGSMYMIWQIMFSSDSYGFINSFLIQWGFISSPIAWLQDQRYILAVVIIVSVWMSLGTSFLAFIAGLQGIDKSLMEAGSVDGITNRWQELWYITLPSMKPQLMFGAVMQITTSFGAGAVSAGLAGLPSVDYSAHTIVNHITDYGGMRFEMGYASAIATILFIVMIVVNEIVQSLLKKVGN
ncbi:MAG: sugar ABC transporter permease [Clostridia bacterium]|nr:sugar ABC transporter permease [Clostridia bacterium]